MGLFDFFRKPEVKADSSYIGSMPIKAPQKDVFKAYIPNYLYKPPFGYPREIDITLIRNLAKTPYIFSVIKTLADEISSLEYDVILRDGEEMTPEIENKIKEIKRFLYNPNKNEESFDTILRAIVRDILEIDAGVIVKVFNRAGKLTQIFARDGSTFLKNPDIYGYLGDREEFVMPVPMEFLNKPVYSITSDGTITYSDVKIQQYYEQNYQEKAAYFQYGFAIGGMPTPYGRREIIYIMQNPRTDSVYGRSPVEVLNEVIQSLYYGILYNLDFYINGNLPEGIISLIGAEREEIKSFIEKMKRQITTTDIFDNRRRVAYRFPVTNTDAKFIPFRFSAKEMQILEQQKWFIKLVWMAFGVTAEEMSYTETSNRAVSMEQAKVLKRKALRPLTSLIQYHLNTQLIPEFFMDKFKDWETAQNKCPVKFVFKHYDIDEDLKKHQLLRMQIDMGIKTPEMVAEELNIDIDKLKESKAERALRAVPIQQNKEVEEKSLSEEDKIAKEIAEYMKNIGEELEKTQW